MSTTKQETRRAAKPQQDSPWPHVRLSETDRLETFSDSVLSITITLLVAEIVRPEYASGQLLEKLTAQWASYIAFLASFFYAGVIWLNHRAVFARVRYCDRSLHLANLFLLLTSALIPLPTAILSAAIQRGNEFGPGLDRLHLEPGRLRLTALGGIGRFLMRQGVMGLVRPSLGG